MAPRVYTGECNNRGLCIQWIVIESAVMHLCGALLIRHVLGNVRSWVMATRLTRPGLSTPHFAPATDPITLEVSRVRKSYNYAVMFGSRLYDCNAVRWLDFMAGLAAQYSLVHGMIKD